MSTVVLRERRQTRSQPASCAKGCTKHELPNRLKSRHPPISKSSGGNVGITLATLLVRPPLGPASNSTKTKRSPGTDNASTEGEGRSFFGGGAKQADEESDEEDGTDARVGAFTSPGGAPPPGRHAGLQAQLLFLFLPFPLPFPLGLRQCFAMCPISPQL